MNSKYTTLLAIAFLLKSCGQMPVIETESIALIPQPVYEIEQVVGNLYRAGSDDHYAAFLVTSEGVILADPLNLGFATWLKEEIANRFDKEVKYVLYSHHHWDHVSGGAVFTDTAEFVAHENFLAGTALPLPVAYAVEDKNEDELLQLSEAGGSALTYYEWLDQNGDGGVTGEEMNRNVVPPTITYSSDHLSVYLGGQEVRMIYAGINHTDDGSIFFFPSESAGFGVDWLLLKNFPRVLYGAGLEHWVEVTDLMASLDISVVLQPHGPPGTMADLKEYGQFFKDLQAELQKAMAAGLSKEEFQASVSLPAYSHWPSYETKLPQLAGEAYELAQQ